MTTSSERTPAKTEAPKNDGVNVEAADPTGFGHSYHAVPARIDLPAVDHEIIALWEKNNTFTKSWEASEGGPRWNFYEGPPTANGQPGTHHIEARVFKDMFPRYKTCLLYTSAVAACDRQQPGEPRLPVQRPARLRKNHLCPHPCALPQL